MAVSYSNLTDRAKIAEIVATQYANMSKMVQSGLVLTEGNIKQGTTEEWLRETLFEGDTGGQAIGVNSQISLQDKVQTLYKMPVCWRADGALLDDIYEEISVKEAQRRAETNLVNGISRKAAQMLDDVYMAILNGYASYAATNDTNYLDKNGSQVSATILQQTKAERSDEGDFDTGIIVARALAIHKLHALGLVAYTSNTMGAQAQDSLVTSGRFVNGTVLGMTMLMTDKLFSQGGTAVDAADHYILLCERGCIRGRNGGAPDIDPIQRKEDSFQDVAKFRIKVGGVVRNMSWQGTAGADGQITNTLLETAGSWTTAVASGNTKYIPIATLRVDQPTF
jgi:hypothetical protein